MLFTVREREPVSSLDQVVTPVLALFLRVTPFCHSRHLTCAGRNPSDNTLSLSEITTDSSVSLSEISMFPTYTVYGGQLLHGGASQWFNRFPPQHICQARLGMIACVFATSAGATVLEQRPHNKNKKDLFNVGLQFKVNISTKVLLADDDMIHANIYR